MYSLQATTAVSYCWLEEFSAFSTRIENYQKNNATILLLIQQYGIMGYFLIAIDSILEILQIILWYSRILLSYNQARSQRPPPSRRAKEIQWGRNFWKQILTDNFIVTQNSCKRVGFFAEKCRNAVKSNAAVRLFSNVR